MKHPIPQLDPVLNPTYRLQYRDGLAYLLVRPYINEEFEQRALLVSTSRGRHPHAPQEIKIVRTSSAPTSVVNKFTTWVFSHLSSESDSEEKVEGELQKHMTTIPYDLYVDDARVLWESAVAHGFVRV
jgi:hypothetical protein